MIQAKNNERQKYEMKTEKGGENYYKLHLSKFSIKPALCVFFLR